MDNTASQVSRFLPAVFLKHPSVAACLILFLFPFFCYWQIGLLQYMMKFDIADEFFPVRFFISECINEGVWPLWNPYQNLGTPVHADMQSGFWYPVTWLISGLVGYSGYVISAEFVLYISLAGIGMFFLLRQAGISRFPAFVAGM